MVARVRKAIIKEKDKDRVFKFSQREAGKPRLLLRSSYSSKEWILSLKLVECLTPTIDEL